jgi:hypothetical protein
MNLSITDNGPSLHFLWTKDSNVPSLWSFFIMHHQVLPDHSFGNDWVKTTSDHEVDENTFTVTLSKYSNTKCTICMINPRTLSLYITQIAY